MQVAEGSDVVRVGPGQLPLSRETDLCRRRHPGYCRRGSQSYPLEHRDAQSGARGFRYGTASADLLVRQQTRRVGQIRRGASSVSANRPGRRGGALAGAVVFGAVFFSVLANAQHDALSNPVNVLLTLAGFIVLGKLMRATMAPPHQQVGIFEHGITVLYPNETWKGMPFEVIDEVWYRAKLLSLDRLRGTYSALVLDSPAYPVPRAPRSSVWPSPAGQAR